MKSEKLFIRPEANKPFIRFSLHTVTTYKVRETEREDVVLRDLNLSK
jgi:hypothetical protein